MLINVQQDKSTLLCVIYEVKTINPELSPPGKQLFPNSLTLNL